MQQQQQIIVFIYLIAMTSRHIRYLIIIIIKHK